VLIFAVLSGCDTVGVSDVEEVKPDTKEVEPVADLQAKVVGGTRVDLQWTLPKDTARLKAIEVVRVSGTGVAVVPEHLATLSASETTCSDNPTAQRWEYVVSAVHEGTTPQGRPLAANAKVVVDLTPGSKK